MTRDPRYDVLFEPVHGALGEAQGGAGITVIEEPVTPVVLEVAHEWGRAIAGIGDLPASEAQLPAQAAGLYIDAAAVEARHHAMVRATLQCPGCPILFDQHRLPLLNLHQAGVVRTKSAVDGENKQQHGSNTGVLGLKTGCWSVL